MFGFMGSRTARISPQDAIETGAILVDVRDQTEVAQTGKAKGALHVPLMRLNDMADPRHPDFVPHLKQDATVAVYCASGARSGMAAQMLERLGYRDVRNMGGLGDWVRAGGALEK